MGTVFVLQTESHLQSALVIGVHDAGHSVPDKSTGNGIDLYLGSIRNLLDTNYYIHTFLILLFKHTGSNHHSLNFGGSLVDLGDLRVPHHPLHGILAGVAVASVEL